MKRSKKKQKRAPERPLSPTPSAASEPPFRSGFAFITTCMGRLEQVKQSSAALLSNPAINGVHNHYVLLDYYCPENTGQWCKQTYGNRVSVLDLAKESPLQPGERAVFSKPIALNAAATYAIRQLRAQYLIFLDADTIVGDTLVDFLLHSACPDRFWIFEPSLAWRDLTGFLLVHSRHFVKVNGFDPAFKGWGAEDLEMRIKLYLRAKAPLNQPRAILKHPEQHSLFWSEIPGSFASSIEHQDTKRTSHYEQKDKDLSNALNLNLLCSNIYNWLGIHPADLHETPLGPYLRRLLGMDLVINPKALE